MNEDGKNILNELKYIFDTTNKWLQFAEAKNGALIAINGTLIFKCIDFFTDSHLGKVKGNEIILIIAIGLFILATSISLISFFPKMGKNNTNNNNVCNCYCLKKIRQNRLLNFYGDISKYNNGTEYLKDIYEFYYTKKKPFHKIELDYSEEIVFNSKVTLRKYKMFKYSVGLDIFAISLIFIFWIMVYLGI